MRPGRAVPSLLLVGNGLRITMEKRPRVGVTPAVKVAKQQDWHRRFQAILRPGTGLVNDYASHLGTQETVCGKPLSEADRSAPRATEAFRRAFAVTSVDDADVERLDSLAPMLGERVKLHTDTPPATPALTGDLYRTCDPVWRRFCGGLDYVVWNIVIKRDGPGHRVPVSIAWYYDTHYPPANFKIRVGLNAGRGGGTELLTAEASARVTDDTGYTGYHLGERVAEPPACTFAPTPGDVLLFWPSRVLHRGLLPPRDRLMLFVSGCPIPRAFGRHREEITRAGCKLSQGIPLVLDVPLFWK